MFLREKDVFLRFPGKTASSVPGGCRTFVVLCKRCHCAVGSPSAGSRGTLTIISPAALTDPSASSSSSSGYLPSVSFASFSMRGSFSKRANSNSFFSFSSVLNTSLCSSARLYDVFSDMVNKILFFLRERSNGRYSSFFRSESALLWSIFTYEYDTPILSAISVSFML